MQSREYRRTAAHLGVEGAGGLGRFLTDQLLGAGERVVDVPPKLAARVRRLKTGQLDRTILAMRARSPWPRRGPAS
jgi:hypothetical protein